MTHESSARRARRRRWLALSCLVALSLWLALNGAFALRDAAPLVDGGARASSYAGDYVPALSSRPLTPEVRLWRWEPLRRLANSLAGPPTVGLQVGHLNAGDQPDELAALRTSTGGHWNGVDEVDVNLEVATRLATLLERRGLIVEILPATVPPAYRADLLLSLHVDASQDEDRRGYKSAHFRPLRNAHEPLLKLRIDRAMLALGLPDDDRNVSGNMLEYYAFNHRRFRHTVARSTPALLVELGYLSNAADRALLSDLDLFAEALGKGVVDYLTVVGRLP